MRLKPSIQHCEEEGGGGGNAILGFVALEGKGNRQSTVVRPPSSCADGIWWVSLVTDP